MAVERGSSLQTSPKHTLLKHGPWRSQDNTVVDVANILTGVRGCWSLVTKQMKDLR